MGTRLYAQVMSYYPYPLLAGKSTGHPAESFRLVISGCRAFRFTCATQIDA